MKSNNCAVGSPRTSPADDASCSWIRTRSCVRGCQRWRSVPCARACRGKLLRWTRWRCVVGWWCILVARYAAAVPRDGGRLTVRETLWQRSRRGKGSNGDVNSAREWRPAEPGPAPARALCRDPHGMGCVYRLVRWWRPARNFCSPHCRCARRRCLQHAQDTRM